MATSAMIEAAVRGPAKPVVGNMHHGAGSTLHRPRSAAEAEETEQGKAARSILRMLLGRHDCPQLPAWAAHGREVCACNPCLDPAHVGDLAFADETLKAFGLKEEARATHRTCGVCGKSKAQSQFGSTRHDTCKGCQVEAKHAGANHA